VSTTVLIAGGDEDLRSRLRLALELAGVDSVDEAETLADTLLQAVAGKAGVILLEQGALAIVPTLLQESADSKIIVLAGRDDPKSVEEAFAAGAAGYLLEDAHASEVAAAVREVTTGGRYVNPELGARLVAAESKSQRQAEDNPLSDREREVLRLLALGHTNQEIAAQLVISVRTAEAHRAHVMEKLGLSTRAELVRYALDRGLLAQ
jgi:two-component system response regulator NreC